MFTFFLETVLLMSVGEFLLQLNNDKSALCVSGWRRVAWRVIGGNKWESSVRDVMRVFHFIHQHTSSLLHISSDVKADERHTPRLCTLHKSTKCSEWKNLKSKLCNLLMECVRLWKWKKNCWVDASLKKILKSSKLICFSWVYLWLQTVLMTSPSGRVTVGVSCVGFCVALCSCHSGFSDFVSVDVSGLTKLLWFIHQCKSDLAYMTKKGCVLCEVRVMIGTRKLEIVESEWYIGCW